MTAASIGRQTRQLVRRIGDNLAGRKRGPDHDPHGLRRVPRRKSYDADDDPRAKPWKPIGDGSVGQGLAYIEALVAAAKEHYQAGWKRYPLAQIRETRIRVSEARAELRLYEGGVQMPVGRGALLRQQLAVDEAWLAAAAKRLRRIDVTVLEGVLRGVDFATGKLFPAIETVADRAGCHRNSVVNALRRLRGHGFIKWVRRSVKTGNDREFGPQREQTSNAYYFEHKHDMHADTWSRYWQLLVAKLKRLGPPGQPPATAPEQPPGEPRTPELRDTLRRIGDLVDRADNAST